VDDCHFDWSDPFGPVHYHPCFRIRLHHRLLCCFVPVLVGDVTPRRKDISNQLNLVTRTFPRRRQTLPKKERGGRTLAIHRRNCDRRLW
jgi:hypothetical protein